ncbi:hypothetical protein [Chitinophaga cymbidii]|uniref:Uncharacterized protein n=1 Tax=Chitinophaga cymbidii TaxID=1096750 RepID=A0A512RQ70_9BACT|nr:hypothetical protein [Chitinophaga cymbidii]GEP97839.1 hypothetical protein CCY01nite_40990 [Chitinophaga cymbidii]
MAIQTSLFTFTGKAANMIGYYRDGKHYFRSMPASVRQTKATKRAALRFGAASKKGRLIRSAFADALDIPYDGSHINRLNKLLIKAGRENNAALAGFRFNQHTGTDRFFCMDPSLSEDGILHIPAQELPQFRGITAFEVKVIATRISFTERRVVRTDTALITLDAREAFGGAALDVDVPGKGTLVVTLQVRGMNGNAPSNNRKYLAADIIAVKEPETAQVFHKPSHGQQAALQQRLQAILDASTREQGQRSLANHPYAHRARPDIQRE